MANLLACEPFLRTLRFFTPENPQFEMVFSSVTFQMKAVAQYFPVALFKEQSYENPVRNRPNLKPCTMQESRRNGDVPTFAYSAKSPKAVSRFEPIKFEIS